MPLAKQGDEQQLHHRLLTNDDPGNIVTNRAGNLLNRGDIDQNSAPR
jgi:hypothetical protein